MLRGVSPRRQASAPAPGSADPQVCTRAWHPAASRSEVGRSYLAPRLGTHLRSQGTQHSMSLHAGARRWCCPYHGAGTWCQLQTPSISRSPATVAQLLWSASALVTPEQPHSQATPNTATYRRDRRCTCPVRVCLGRPAGAFALLPRVHPSRPAAGAARCEPQTQCPNGELCARRCRACESCCYRGRRCRGLPTTVVRNAAARTHRRCGAVPGTNVAWSLNLGFLFSERRRTARRRRSSSDPTTAPEYAPGPGESVG